MMLSVVLVAWVFFVMERGDRRKRFLAVIVATYGVILALSVALLLSARLPERVTYNMPFFILALCVYWTTCSGESVSPLPFKFGLESLVSLRKQRVFSVFVQEFRPHLISIAALLTLSLVFFWGECQCHFNAEHVKLKNRSASIFAPVQKLLPAGQKPIIVLLPCNSRLEFSLFFWTEKEPPFYCVPYGWLTHSPIFQKILEQHHLTPFSRSLLDRPDVFLLMQPSWIEPLTTFYWEHYKMRVRFDQVLTPEELKEKDKKSGQALYQAHLENAETPDPAESDEEMAS